MRFYRSRLNPTRFLRRLWKFQYCRPVIMVLTDDAFVTGL
jgi:hypothetical protein